MTSRTNTAAGRLERAGRLLFGDRWQSPLARAIGVVPSLLSMVVAGERPITADLQRKLAAALRTEAARLRSSAEKLDRLRSEIETDLPSD